MVDDDGREQARVFWQTLLRRLGRSLAVYTVQARPWVPYRREELWELLEEIGSQHKEWAGRLAELVAEFDGLPQLGSFPPAFVRYNDVSIDIVAVHVLKDLRQIAALFENAGSVSGITEAEASFIREIEAGIKSQIAALEKALVQARILPPQAQG